MRIETLVLGELQTNCYLVCDEESKRGVIIDPGADALQISARLSEYGIVPEAILLTHGHFDHILAVDDLRKQYRIPVYIHEKEEKLLANPRVNLSGFWSEPFATTADYLLKDGECFKFGLLEFRVFHTPGHTEGGVCYSMEKEGVLFSGDTLFYGSYGRTDFPGGSLSALRSSIREKLLCLPETVIVYPGHGQATDIAWEQKFNPMAAGWR